MSDTVYNVAMTVKRVRPRISVTLDPDVYRRLIRLRDTLPGGASASALVNEVLAVGLPALEEVAAAMKRAMKEDGTVDQDKALDDLSRFVGSHLLGLSDKVAEIKREASTG